MVGRGLFPMKVLRRAMVRATCLTATLLICCALQAWPQQQTAPAPAAQPPQAKPAPAALPKGVDPQNAIFIDTKYGRIAIKLRPDLAPKHVERIKQLAREKFYDNVPFHRVIAGFMAQTGDGQNGDGTGGSKYPNLPAEFSNVPYARGIVGMARTSDPNSANSQFFIMFVPNSSLDGRYTVIGRVVKGMDVVDKITPGEPPSDPTKIVKAYLGS